MPSRTGCRELASLQNALGSRHQCSDFLRRQNLGQPDRKVAGKRGAKFTDGLHLIIRYPSSDEVPQHRPELRRGVEADPMIDCPHALGRIKQDVTGLTIRVVQDQIEHRDSPKLGCVRLEKIEGSDLWVVFYVELHRSQSQWPFPEHRRRNETPSPRLADQIGCELALTESPGGKVPQWRFALARLVDGKTFPGRGPLRNRELGEISVIRRPRDLVEDLELPAKEFVGCDQISTPL